MAEVRSEPAGTDNVPPADIAEMLAGMMDGEGVSPDNDWYLEVLWHLFHVHDDVLER